jgi:DNA-binding NtrC family response regulator
VLFHGEAGTGKARAARRLHTLRHPQAPFLAMAAAALGPAVKELALLQGGSLYVTDLDQLEDGVELVAAMDSPAGRNVHWMGGCREPQTLPEAVRLRLGALIFRLPPLRERREDLLPIFRAFLERQARREGRPTPIVERSLERDLLQRSWPGNIRQLTWALVQSLGATTGAVLAPLPPEGAQRGGVLVLPYPEPGPMDAMLDAVLRDAAGALLRRALDGRRGDPAAVAQELGLTPRALAKALKDHAIPLEEGTP